MITGALVGCMAGLVLPVIPCGPLGTMLGCGSLGGLLGGPLDAMSAGVAVVLYIGAMVCASVVDLVGQICG